MFYMAATTLTEIHVSHVVTPSPSAARFYRPELDVLRLLAFLLVFMNHAGLDLTHLHSGPLFKALDVTIKSMHYGLCMFFFLSSYLISELLQMERERTGSVHLKAFYIRRILRIWPLYFVFLLVVGVGCSIFVGWKVEPARLAAFTFLLGNWYTAAHGLGDTPIYPLWSISVEEQFYVLWPFLAKFGGIRALVGASIVLLPVAAISLLVLTLHGASREGQVWMNSFVQFLFFALGALLASVLKRRTPQLPSLGRVALFCSGLATWVIATYACGISDVGPAS
jgi:peptidoglycan/LPS O-acetylase OafA/YrhL